MSTLNMRSCVLWQRQVRFQPKNSPSCRLISRSAATVTGLHQEMLDINSIWLTQAQRLEPEMRGQHSVLRTKILGTLQDAGAQFSEPIRKEIAAPPVKFRLFEMFQITRSGSGRRRRLPSLPAFLALRLGRISIFRKGILITPRSSRLTPRLLEPPMPVSLPLAQSNAPIRTKSSRRFGAKTCDFPSPSARRR